MRVASSVYDADMKEAEIPCNAVEVTESELQAKLEAFLELVAFTEEELVVTRNGQAIAAVISMDGYRALRRVVGEIQRALESGAGPEDRLDLVIRSQS
jgi:prevent-host-death family protein